MKVAIASTTLSLALSIGLSAPAADAATYSNGTATATFNVTLTLQPNCTIAANPLAFGQRVLATAINQQTTVSVTCTNTTPYNVGLELVTRG